MRLGLLLLGLLVVIGCGRSHEDVMEDMASTTEEFAATVEKCGTSEGLEANRGKLKELGERISELDEELKGLGEASADEAVAMMKQGFRFVAAQLKIQTARAAIEDEATRKIIDDALSAGE